MKRIIFLSGMVLLCLTASAQTDYYAGKEYVSGDWGSYKVTVTKYGSIKLEDSTNMFSFKPEVYMDGTPIENSPDMIVYGVDANFPKISLRAARETFTAEEIMYLRDESLFIGFYTDTRTAKLREVGFIVDCTSKLCFIPPYKFRILEQKLKEYAIITVPDYAKAVQVVNMTYILNFKWLAKELE